ncbi:tyrosine kinase receptor Cad96Ca-like [Stylophora pistillata]|uniref:tyrosine kinase receptor Cad96Ca-like n=1 Tax=Stylophora pistillata TaxID=50429 RepID=UPI000C045DAB|nr:tyrosine kinase receptor Cad96Ca-like [Stylophora pistillata]
MHLKIIYGLASLSALCIVSFVSYIIYNRWNRLRNAQLTLTSVEVNEAHWRDKHKLPLHGPWNRRRNTHLEKILKTRDSRVVVNEINAKKKDLQDMLTELDLMKTLKPHPHVVELIGYCIEKDPLLIVLEYLPYGDLLGYLLKSRGIEDIKNTREKKPSSSLTKEDLLRFVWMIADGMSYLSRMKIVHRDLSARNVLVGDNKVCKISDFGLARGLREDVYTRKTEARLPARWMPPESLLYGESSTKSDIWSYGIVMWEVFTIGESPYPGVKSGEIADLLQTGYRMPKPPHISQELYSIMANCWEEKPEERPTFQWLCCVIRRLLDDHKL